MQIQPIPLLQDNYAWLLLSPISRECVIVDPSEAAPVIQVLEQGGLSLRAILLTHHHWDHVSGVPDLLQHAPHIPVYASHKDAEHIPSATHTLVDGQTIEVLDTKAQCLLVPGHTLGACAYYLEKEKALFTGDTLFLAGCGRLFEGTPAQMHASLMRLATLPNDTMVYCGHEYTEKNLQFAASVEPNNVAVSSRLKQVQALRAQGRPTPPAALEIEKATNPFLRSDAVKKFASLRQLRDGF